MRPPTPKTDASASNGVHPIAKKKLALGFIFPNNKEAETFEAWIGLGTPVPDDGKDALPHSSAARVVSDVGRTLTHVT